MFEPHLPSGRATIGRYARRARGWRRQPQRSLALAGSIALAALAAGTGLAAEQHGPTAGPQEAPAPVSLTVRLHGLQNDKGRVAVALFSSAKDFPDQRRALVGRIGKIAGGRASVAFSNLQPGVYAVAVLHDENENSKMDFNFLGMPLEGFGFSNDASAPFGPPSFEAAAFKLAPRNSFVPIKMRYFF